VRFILPFAPFSFMHVKEFAERHADVLLVGLPGIGRVGHLAAAYILNKLDHELVMEFYSEYFPPQVVVENGSLRLIRNQLFYVRADKPFLLLTGDSQVVGNSPPEHYVYAEALLDSILPLGVKEIYTMAGIDRGASRFTEFPGVTVAATDEDILNKFKELGAKVDSGGAITGAAGLLLGLGTLRGVKGACLMGETSAQLTMHGDPSAALSVIRLLFTYLGIEFDYSDLEKASENFEELLKKMTAPSPEEKKAPEPSDYIR
jgi:uncharacterized protein (TIGR00162 family)